MNTQNRASSRAKKFPLFVQLPPTDTTPSSPTTNTPPPIINQQPRCSIDQFFYSMPRERIQTDDSCIEEEKKSDQDSLESPPANTQHCFRPLAEEDTQKLVPSISHEIVRALSSSPLSAMPHSALDTSSLHEGVTSFQSLEAAIPRRNLQEAFEELYVDTQDTSDTPVVKQSSSKDPLTNMISPTGVADLHTQDSPCITSDAALAAQDNVVTPQREMKVPTGNLPHFELHKDLQRDLSDALVDRVSFYAIIHDINKEASSMAAHDESGFNRTPEESNEAYDTLIVAVNGQPKEPFEASTSPIHSALIDDEQWLLDTIDAQGIDESRSIKACPPTFLQAMGERDYDNPLASLSNGSRTQLWKPSRSWWEAKSGKNPWIEPTSHNKRWRYLWPLIHYHKFLAKCIKKLKRNGVDVKTSVSPVSVFLREEVCAVSDHLATVSLFDSDRWMACLAHFKGWTDTSAEVEANLRDLIAKLKLRPLVEPGDVDSVLLRSQIDERFLRAMADARAQLSISGSDSVGRTGRSNRDQPNRQSQTPEGRGKKKGRIPAQPSGPPPTHPRQPMTASSHRAPPRAINGPSPQSLRRARYGFPPHHPHWYGGWHPHAHFGHYGTDDSSVHSGLSGESYAHSYDMNMYQGPMHPSPYYHPMMYAHHPHLHPPPGFDPSMQGSMYNTGHDYSGGLYAGTAEPMQPHDVGELSGAAAATASIPGTPCASAAKESTGNISQPTAAQSEGDHTPYKYNPSSPYWAHLDQTTLAMMGLASPQGMASPQTPSRNLRPSLERTIEDTTEDSSSAGHVNVQPLLLRHHQYASYGVSYSNNEGYVPPSPATQFMMSPQANFGYHYGGYGGYSPSRGKEDDVHSPMAADIPVSATPTRRPTSTEEKTTGK